MTAASSSLSLGGAEPAARVDRVFDASRHVVIPGLVNTHHHMFQTHTRAHPAALNKELFPWLDVAVSHLGETPQSR
jgi:8-oxoguanine deaminase